MSDASAWEARFRRERKARKEAELLFGERSQELWQSNEALKASLGELGAAQGALVQREKLAAVGSLVAGVAHEINTPLGVALTAASYAVDALSMLERDVASGKLTKSALTASLTELREATSLMLGNVERAAQLVRSFKMVAVDQQTEGIRRLEVGAFLRDLVASLRPMLRSAGVEVDVEVDGTLDIVATAGPLGQIVTNLLQNACVHAFRGVEPGAPRRVRVLGHADATHLHLQVSDNGEGIAESLRHRVLEPFFTTRRDSGGTGLGLHIVHTLVAQHFHGSLAFSSEVGEGTTFHARLPWGTASLQRVVA